MTDLYEADFVLCLRQQADFARNGQTDQLDLANIAEELEGLARAEETYVQKRLRRIMTNLLRLQYPPTGAESERQDWRCDIIGDRGDIERSLEMSPSLRNMLTNFVADEWPEVIGMVADDCGLPKDRFPPTCPWTEEQLLDNDFLPE